jgi:hypothetical protein
MTTTRKSGTYQRAQATMELGEDHAVQVLQLASGIQAIVEGGRAVKQLPSTRSEVEAPPEAGIVKSGEHAASHDILVHDAGEQDWFKNTFCNGAQTCIQGFEFTDFVTDHAVGSATGISMVGSEGSTGTLTVSVWECICSGPFCIGGHHCFWVENWKGLVLPGHWLSVDTRSSDNAYLRWELTGAGGDTQVSFAARF